MIHTLTEHWTSVCVSVFVCVTEPSQTNPIVPLNGDLQGQNQYWNWWWPRKYASHGNITVIFAFIQTNKLLSRLFETIFFCSVFLTIDIQTNSRFVSFVSTELWALQKCLYSRIKRNAKTTTIIFMVYNISAKCVFILHNFITFEDSHAHSYTIEKDWKKRAHQKNTSFFPPFFQTML